MAVQVKSGHKNKRVPRSAAGAGGAMCATATWPWGRWRWGWTPWRGRRTEQPCLKLAGRCTSSVAAGKGTCGPVLNALHQCPYRGGHKAIQRTQEDALQLKAEGCTPGGLGSVGAGGSGAPYSADTAAGSTSRRAPRFAATCSHERSEHAVMSAVNARSCAQ